MEASSTQQPESKSNEPLQKGSESQAVAAASSASAVVLREEDLKFLMDECEVSREAAESLLRTNGGDLKRAVQAYIKSPVAIN